MKGMTQSLTTHDLDERFPLRASEQTTGSPRVVLRGDRNQELDLTLLLALDVDLSEATQRNLRPA